MTNVADTHTKTPASETHSSQAMVYLQQMKKTISLFITLVLLFQAFAHETETPHAALPEPGTTPDNWIYFFDVALENLALALTFDTDARIEKQLAFAEERLAEVRAMALGGKIESIAKAERKHGELLVKLKTELEDVNDTDSEGELRKELEIEQKIKHHEEKVDDVKEELKISIKTEGDVTPEQQSLIDSVLANLKGQVGEVEIEIENEKGKTKIKIEQETGKSSEEIELELEQELGITADEKEDTEEELVENADESLEDVEDTLEEFEQKEKEEDERDEEDEDENDEED